MKFIENTRTSTSCTETHPRCTFNPAKQLIRSDIAESMIRVSEFTHDMHDEVYVVMTHAETPTYLPMHSKEVESAIYWVGLVSGVKLDVDDICDIIEELTYYAIVKDGKTCFLEDDSQNVKADR